MPTQYKAPVEDYLFVLHDVLKSETAHSLGELSREDSRAVLEQAARFFEEKWAPLDAVGDEHGCRFDNGAVTTPPGYKEGYASMCEAGW